MTIRRMTASRIGPIIDRTYRETSRYQWAREVAMNAIEAGATRIDFTVEAQGMAKGVYRRLIADNGKGMSADELETFFNDYGAGGKPIGAEHENFGIGAKTTLLPWNKLGVVVISWQNGVANMIRIQQESDGEYGLRVYEAEGDEGETRDEVVEPFYDEELDIDWTKVKPDWFDKHGTVIVLLGNSPTQDTFRGDPNPDRNEDVVRGLVSYLNHRFWEPKANIRVLEFTRESWPKELVGPGGFDESGFIYRAVYGMAYYVANPSTFPKVELLSGTVQAKDTAIDWYLWAAPRTSAQYRDSRMPRIGSTSVHYQNEMYDIDPGFTATMRSFGICEKVVADNLWLIMQPPVHTAAQHGVYPRADRSQLLWSGGRDLPMREWAEVFANNLPVPIIEALKRARKDTPSSIEDQKWREKLAQRFGFRWKLPRLKPTKDGEDQAGAKTIENVTPIPRDNPPRPNPSPGPRPRPRPRRIVDKTSTYAQEGNGYQRRNHLLNWEFQTAFSAILRSMPIPEWLQAGARQAHQNPMGLLQFGGYIRLWLTS